MPQRKSIYQGLLIFTLLLIIFILALSRGEVASPEEMEYGITFSKKKAEDLGFDWKKMYLDSLDELGLKRLRLSAYWDEIERSDGSYDWSDVDWQVEEARRRGVSVILAMGGRLPRWPECHFPEWSKNYPKAHREERILSYVKQTVLRYKDRENITAWQVENEPFLAHFGDCPQLDSSFLDMEIGLVKSLDRRPIVVTDSGELSLWIPAARRADIFGTTMYRDTYSSHLKSYIHYPISPNFFQFKRNIADLFAEPDKWIVIELQAEPWCPEPYELVSNEERDRTMNLEKLREIIEFARQSGFQELYLWGVEWWYWEKEANGNAELWEEAKRIFEQ